MYRISVCLLVSCLFLAFPCSASAEWSRDFAPMGLSLAPEVTCLVEWNGNLYVGGEFDNAGGVDVNHIAKWNGSYWEALGDGLNNHPNCLYAYGSAMVAGGPFWQAGDKDVSYIAKWDGYEWFGMGELDNPPNDICTHFDNLAVCGSFPPIEVGEIWSPVMIYSGLQWQQPDNAIPWNGEHEAYSIAHFNSKLYIGGWFWNSSLNHPDDTYNIMALNDDGTTVCFGTGVNGTVFDVLAGDMGVYLGGGFTQVDGDECNGLVWLSSGGTFLPVEFASQERQVEAMVMHQGILHTVVRTGSYPYEFKVRKYYGTTWSDPLGGEIDGTVTEIQGVDGVDLYIGGTFRNGVARWDDDEWVHLGGGIGTRNQDNFHMRTLAAWNGGVVAGGMFDLPAIMEDQLFSEDVAFWDGDAWHRMGGGTPSGTVTDLIVYKGELYAATQSSGRFYHWNEEAEIWDIVTSINGQVKAMAVHDGELILGGSFTSVDGQSIDRLAAWDGVSWRLLGSGTDNTVEALLSVNGSLFAAGNFTTVGGVSALRVARWDGETWHALGEGLDSYVFALTHFNGELHAGGSFSNSGGTPCARIARWDGAAWQPLGDGLAGADMVIGVDALRGTTTALYVGGDFDTAGGVPALALAVWDGASWSEFGGGVHYDAFRPTVMDIMVLGGDLWVAGNFNTVDNITSCNIACWRDGTLVGNMLKEFRIIPGPTGREVDLQWSVDGAAAAADFSLTARSESSSRELDVVKTADAFSALDTQPSAGANEYTLKLRTNGQWVRLARETRNLIPPAETILHAAAPNPFNPRTTITFDLDRPQMVELAVYDLCGRCCAVLASGYLGQGSHRRDWEGQDQSGRSLSSGTYLVRLKTDTGVSTRKLMLMR